MRSVGATSAYGDRCVRWRTSRCLRRPHRPVTIPEPPSTPTRTAPGTRRGAAAPPVPCCCRLRTRRTTCRAITSHNPDRATKDGTSRPTARSRTAISLTHHSRPFSTRGRSRRRSSVTAPRRRRKTPANRQAVGPTAERGGSTRLRASSAPQRRVPRAGSGEVPRAGAGGQTGAAQEEAATYKSTRFQRAKPASSRRTTQSAHPAAL